MNTLSLKNTLKTLGAISWMTLGLMVAQGRTRRLRLEAHEIYAGNALKNFKPAQALKFLTVDEARQAVPAQ